MYCNKCGALNPDGSAFCSTCGAKLIPPSQYNASSIHRQPQSSWTHTVTIYRESQLFLINPPMNILIDGHDHRSIGNGETLSLDLPAGPHSIQFYMGARRRDLDITLINDIVISVKWSRGTGAIKAELHNN